MSARVKTVEPEALAVLRGVEWEGNVAKLPPRQLERKLYVKVNEVLEALGGKWKRGVGHVFTDDASAQLEWLIEQGIYRVGGEKQELQQFFTPPDLADKVVQLAGIKSEHDVLEPSAGRGALLRAVEAVCKPRVLVAVELSPGLAGLLGDWSGGADYRLAYHWDFLAWRPGLLFDRVVMNPPFTKQQDLDHVTHAFALLRAGGRLVAITSPGWTFRENRKSKEFQALVDDCGTFEGVDRGTFKESGTDVSSVIVVLNK